MPPAQIALAAEAHRPPCECLPGVLLVGLALTGPWTHAGPQSASGSQARTWLEHGLRHGAHMSWPQGSRLKAQAPPPEVWPRRARKPRRTRMLAAAWYESVGTRQVTIPAAGESEILRGRVLRTQCDVSNQRSAAEGSRILNLDIQVTHLAHRAGQDSLYLVRTTCLKFRSNMKRNRSCGQAADIRASAPRNAAAPLLVIQCRLPPQSPSIHRLRGCP